MKKLFLVVFMAVTLVVAGQSTVFAAGESGVATGANIISPYWAANANSYTFLAIANTSMSGNVSTAVTVYAIHRDQTLAGTALTLTIEPGKVQRIFILATGKYTAGIWTNARLENLIVTSKNAQGGQLVIGLSSMANPSANVATLSVFGAIFNPTAMAGFPMGFIGDLVDSIVGGTTSGAGDAKAL